MRAEKVSCTGNACVVYGDTTLHAEVDYVFAYTPTVVRLSPPDRADLYFEPPVDCEKREDYDAGVSYLYCAPVLLPTRVVFEGGEAYLLEVDGDE